MWLWKNDLSVHLILDGICFSFFLLSILDVYLLFVCFLEFKISKKRNRTIEIDEFKNNIGQVNKIKKVINEKKNSK